MVGDPAGVRRPEPAILVEGRNSWRIADADRAAFLVDGAAYYAAFKDAVSRARRQVLIVGWDINTRVRLTRPRRGPWPDRLGPFLHAVASRRDGPEIHVLIWDFAMIYALERQWFPSLGRGRSSHPRLHLEFDGNHPTGASQHQKIVVVDDRIAFVGGLDVTVSRWDTPEHRARDRRRVNANGKRYGPFHDVQVAVSGEAAGALGDLARERWRRVTGRALEPPPRVDADPWPPSLRPDVERVRAGIARTEPAWEGREQVREVEALHLDAIAAARRSIFIENQYLTSGRIGDALAARLGEEDGPEVLAILPQTCTGWLEEATMGVARGRLLERLAKADRRGRLRVYYPVVPNLDGGRVNVHSKVLVIDDRLVRIGSSNASNRSMGLDSECDVAIESRGDPAVEAAVARFRNGLLGEHLGVAREAVAGAIDARGSLRAAVESLAGGPRTLVPLEPSVPELLDRIVPDNDVLDPEQPVDAERLAAMILPTTSELTPRHLLLAALAAAVVLGGLAAWRLRPGRA